MEADEEQCNLLLRDLDLVEETNRHVNLTRITDPESAVTLHVVDSLTLLPRFLESQKKTHLPYLDLGTGAGFPGIPLAVMSSSQGLLIDSTQKKISAVADFIEKLGLDDRIGADAVRAEELALTHKRQFGTVVARAVAPLSVLIEYASPLLCRHGALVVSKGQLSDEEYDDSLYAAELCGMDFVSRETIELPRDMGHREILVYTRERNPQIKLPRRAGMAQHHPLARP
ncbi:MAG: 16S rRNA (guanine(527)-N(7))-methyltransferase RsmG [Atopobiaceae bacterium]